MMHIVASDWAKPTETDEMKVHLTIWDQQGNQLFHGQVTSCFDSLRPGDAFWIGDPHARQWMKVARMTYGVCTLDGGVHLEMVVENSEIQLTRFAQATSQIVDHGTIECPPKGGVFTFPKGSWFTLDIGGYYNRSGVQFLTIRYRDSVGREDAKSFTNIIIGEELTLRTGAFELKVKVLFTGYNQSTCFQITEERTA